MPKTDSTGTTVNNSTRTAPAEQSAQLPNPIDSAKPTEDSLNIPENAHSAHATTQGHRIRAPAQQPIVKQYRYYHAYGGTLEDSFILTELRIGRYLTTASIKMKGHGGQGELKNLSLFNLSVLAEQILKILNDYPSLRPNRH